MSRASDTTEFLNQLSRSSTQQRLLRVAVLVLPVLALVAEVRAGADPSFLVLAPFILFTALSVALPDSHAPLAVVLILGVYWALAIEEALSVSLLLVTALLLAFHVACLLTSYGPSSLVLDPPLVTAWVRRAAVTLAAAVLVWLAARLFTGLDLPANGALLAVALLVVVVWIAVLTRRLAVRNR